MKTYRPDLVDNCPSCGISFQKPPTIKIENGKKHTYSNTPVMASIQNGVEALACMNCGIHEGREIIQAGYRNLGFFQDVLIPPIYGTRTWKLRRIR